MSIHLSPELRMKLWEEHPLCAELNERKKAAGPYVGFLKEEMAPSKYEDVKRYMEWDPVPKDSSRDIKKLLKHIHPAAFEEHKLRRINDLGLSFFKSFIWFPQLEEEIPNPKLVGHYITLHSNNSPVVFKPNSREVLVQLPEEVINSDKELYFTTDLICDDTSCAVGYAQQYHVAVTSVYSS